MYALFKLEYSKISLILTEHKNIDWLVNEVTGDIEEFIMRPNKAIKCFNVLLNQIENITVSEINEDRHRVIIGDKKYVILHKIKL